jgi:hypothetical protein
MGGVRAAQPPSHPPPPGIIEMIPGSEPSYVNKRLETIQIRDR